MSGARARVENVPDVRSARQRIVAGARSHFFASGFRGVSMDDLAAELGMSKKTLYAHFRSKLEVVEAAIHDKFGELEAELKRITAQKAVPFAESLRLLLACVLRHVEEVRPAFLRDMQRADPDLFRIVEKRRAALIHKHFGALFDAGRMAKLVRTDIPTEVIVEILLGAVQGVLTPHKLADLELTPRAGFTAIISVVLDGVLTASGRAKR